MLAQSQNSAHAASSNDGGPLREMSLIEPAFVDRRLAYKNLRTGLIAGAIALVVFGLAWVVGLVY